METAWQLQSAGLRWLPAEMPAALAGFNGMWPPWQERHWERDLAKNLYKCKQQHCSLWVSLVWGYARQMQSPQRESFQGRCLYQKFLGWVISVGRSRGLVFSCRWIPFSPAYAQEGFTAHASEGQWEQGPAETSWGKWDAQKMTCIIPCTFMLVTGDLRCENSQHPICSEQSFPARRGAGKQTGLSFQPSSTVPLLSWDIFFSFVEIGECLIWSTRKLQRKRLRAAQDPNSLWESVLCI